MPNYLRQQAKKAQLIAYQRKEQLLTAHEAAHQIAKIQAILPIASIYESKTQQKHRAIINVIANDLRR